MTNHVFEKQKNLLRENVWRTVRAIKSSMKAKSLLPVENPLLLIVSSFNVACAYAYIRSIAGLYFLFGLTGCVARGSSGQDSDDWLVFELRCPTWNTILIESFYFGIFNGFRKVVPWFGSAWRVQAICFFISFFVDHSIMHSVRRGIEQQL